MKDAIEKIQIWIKYVGRVADYLGSIPINFPTLPYDQINKINERIKRDRPGPGPEPGPGNKPGPGPGPGNPGK
jgi:hypothetical protein